MDMDTRLRTIQMMAVPRGEDDNFWNILLKSIEDSA